MWLFWLSLSRLLFFVWKHNILLCWLVFVVSYRRAPSQSKTNKASRCLARINLSSTEDAQKDFCFNHSKYRGDPECNLPGELIQSQKTSIIVFHAPTCPPMRPANGASHVPSAAKHCGYSIGPEQSVLFRQERRRWVFLAKAHPAKLSVQMWAQRQSGLKSVCV